MLLKISIAQMAVKTSDPQGNLRKAENWIAQAAQKGSHLIFFPEMWTTGFDWDYNERVGAEQEKVIEKVADMARRYRIWINGSVLSLNENGRVSNTSILFNSKGERVGTYRKIHLFSVIHEDEHMAPGQSLTTVDTPWGLAGLSICYDLRFPELFRSYALKGVKLIFLPAAFPHPKLEHWKVLLRARAIENQMFMIAANQVGSEDLGPDGLITYLGHSMVIDPWGEIILEGGEKEEALLSTAIDMDRVDEIRSKMKVFQDRRPDLYELK